MYLAELKNRGIHIFDEDFFLFSLCCVEKRTSKAIWVSEFSCMVDVPGLGLVRTRVCPFR